MLKLFVALQNLRHDTRGVTVIEYAMLAGGIAVLVLALTGKGGALKDGLDTLFDQVFDKAKLK